MKKQFILYFLLAIIVYACEDKELIKQSQNIEVTANILSSRTAYSSENGVTNVSWVIGDEIGLFSSNQTNVRYIAKNTGENSSFEAFDYSLLANEGDSIWAYYPFEYGFQNNRIMVPRIVSQRYCEKGWKNNNLLPETDFMTAKGKVENGRVNLQFEHFFAFLKITLPIHFLDINEERFGIEIISTENICTYNKNCCYDLQSGRIDTLKADMANNLHYDLTGIDTNKDEVTFYVTILPQTENANITIQKYYYTDNKYVDGNFLLHGKKTPKGGFQAGKVYFINFNDALENNGNIDWLPEYEF